MKYARQFKRRQKLRSEGRCPRCGKPAFPFYYCEFHRVYCNIHRAIRKGLKTGALKQNDQGELSVVDIDKIDFTSRIKKDDARLLPRLGNRPWKLEKSIVEVLKHQSRHMTIEEITEELIKMKVQKSLTGANSKRVKFLEALKYYK